MFVQATDGNVAYFFCPSLCFAPKPACRTLLDLILSLFSPLNLPLCVYSGDGPAFSMPGRMFDRLPEGPGPGEYDLSKRLKRGEAVG